MDAEAGNSPTTEKYYLLFRALRCLRIALNLKDCALWWLGSCAICFRDRCLHSMYAFQSFPFPSSTCIKKVKTGLRLFDVLFPKRLAKYICSSSRQVASGVANELRVLRGWLATGNLVDRQIDRLSHQRYCLSSTSFRIPMISPMFIGRMLVDAYTKISGPLWEGQPSGTPLPRHRRLALWRVVRLALYRSIYINSRPSIVENGN